MWTFTKLALLTFLLCISLLFVADVSGERYYGIAYSPYRLFGHCPSQAEIDQDRNIFLSYTNRIRLYSTECNLLNDVVLKSATENQIEVLLGVWIDGRPQDQSEIQNLYVYLEKYPHAKLVGISVGNEVLYRRTVSPHALANMVREVKHRVREIGNRLGSYNLQRVPVFSVDVIPNPLVVSQSDAIGINVHPYYRTDLPRSNDPNIMSDYCLSSSIEQITAFRSLYAGKEVFVTETGWPTASAPHERNRGDLQVSKLYRQKFGGWADQMRLKYFIFELVDSPWKQTQYPHEPPTLHEFHWGIFNVQRQKK